MFFNRHNKQNKKKNKVISPLENHISKHIKKEPTQDRVKDEKTKIGFGILLMDQKSINDIKKNSGKEVNSCEYQVHYSALNMMVKHRNERLDICIPLVYYNYKQKVSSASVDFELTEVEEISDALKPYVQKLAQTTLKSKLIETLKTLFHDAEEIKFTTTALNNIHKHPGKMHSFSGTDYDKNISNPGICFPLNGITAERPIFSSIMTHNPLEIGHTEYRLANGSTEKLNLEYKHGRSITLVKGYEIEKTYFEKVFDISNETKKPYIVKDGLTINDVIELIAKHLNESDYTACTKFVKPEHVEKKNTIIHHYQHNKGFGYRNMNLLYEEDDDQNDAKGFFPDTDTNTEEPTTNDIPDITEDDTEETDVDKTIDDMIASDVDGMKTDLAAFGVPEIRLNAMTDDEVLNAYEKAVGI